MKSMYRSYFIRKEFVLTVLLRLSEEEVSRRRDSNFHNDAELPSVVDQQKIKLIDLTLISIWICWSMYIEAFSFLKTDFGAKERTLLDLVSLYRRAIDRATHLTILSCLAV